MTRLSALGAAALLRRLMDGAPRWLDRLPDLPDLAWNTMMQVGELTQASRAQLTRLAEVQQALDAQARRSRFQRLGGLALIAAVMSLLLPAAGYAGEIDPVVPGSLLGSLGIYWMYIHS